MFASFSQRARVRECVRLLRSHFPLQAERLLHVVVATAQVDEADVGAHRHPGLVLLLQLQSALQVLVGWDGMRGVVGRGNSSGRLAW